MHQVKLIGKSVSAWPTDGRWDGAYIYHGIRLNNTSNNPTKYKIPNIEQNIIALQSYLILIIPI
jgi:hypothetical protein